MKTLADQTSRLFGRLPCLVLLACAGCATTTSTKAPEPSSEIEMVDQFGFTMTEDTRISDEVRLDYAQALAYFEQGWQDEGIELLETVAQAAPTLSAPRIDLGIAYHQLGDLENAQRYLLEALALNAEHPTAHNELGIVYRKQGEFQLARQSYEAALAVYPGYHYARRNLAILCDLYLADLTCALENYEAYMETVPVDAEAEIWIADIRTRLGQ